MTNRTNLRQFFMRLLCSRLQKMKILYPLLVVILGISVTFVTLNSAFAPCAVGVLCGDIRPLPSPLTQLKQGIEAKNVLCHDGFVLLLKSRDNSPACVKPATAEKLVERGWGTIVPNQGGSLQPVPQILPNGTSIIVLSEGQRFGPLLVQNISENSVSGLDFREFPLATNVGYPINLHIGDSASNGCTVVLTLAKISGISATFILNEYHNRPCPICLSGDSVIDTPSGPINVKALKVGMSILTQDSFGHKQTGIILKTGKTLVPPDHMMVHVILNNTRELYASPNHPTTDGRLFGELKHGDVLDGSKIKNIELVPYNQPYTYDVLPSGDTGFYWANGILVGSTLK